MDDLSYILEHCYLSFCVTEITSHCYNVIKVHSYGFTLALAMWTTGIAWFAMTDSNSGFYFSRFLELLVIAVHVS